MAIDPVRGYVPSLPGGPDEHFSESRNWFAVDSSNVAMVAHHAASNTLAVRFLAKGGRGGSEYHYLGVDAGVFEALLSAGSVGGYLHEAVKGSYPYRKVR